MIDWLSRTWDETNPMKVIELPPTNTWPMINTRLRGEGWDDDALKRLKVNPQRFPHTMRRFGFDFERGVMGNGFAARTVGMAHYLWARLARGH